MSVEPVEEPTAVSVIVAVRSADPRPDACLAAITRQLRAGFELIVVTDGPTDAVGPASGPARLVSRPGELVPRLWAAGIDAARGDIVLLTAGTLVPDPDWVEQAVRALEVSGRVAVAGAIEPGPGFTLADWAYYFCRYAPYQLPFATGIDVELPADNAGYVRAALLRHRERWADGFWEPFVHTALRDDGALVMVPDVVVRLTSGHAVQPFARARFRHGQEHGRQRALGRPRGKVLAAAATFPAVPALMTYRAARTVARRHRRGTRFLLSLPILVWFYTWWAAGELVGRLQVVAGR